MNLATDSVIKNTIHDYFQGSFCLYVFMNNVSLAENLQEFQTFKYSADNINMLDTNHHCVGIVINSDDPKSVFEAIETWIKYQNDTRVQNNYRKYLVLVAGEMKCLDIFESMGLHFVIDLLNICYSEYVSDTFSTVMEYELSFYTHKYVGDDGNAPVLLDKWFSKNSTFLLGNSLNPDKLGDQEGRLLKVATFTYGLYSRPDINYGSDLSLIKEYAKRHNNSLKVLVIQDELWGQTFPNFSGTGIFGQVMADEADIGFCGMFFWLSRYWYLDYSQYYGRTGITCLVPTPTVFIEWSDVFQDLSGYLPLIKLVIILSCGLVFYLAELLHILTYNKKQGRNLFSFSIVKRICLIMLQIALLITAPLIEKSRLKLLYIYLYFVSIIMYNIQVGTLSSKLAAHRYKDAINTVDELAARNIIWIGNQADSWLDSIRYEESDAYKIVVQNFRQFDEIDENAENEAAYGAERLMSGNLLIDDSISLDMLKHLEIMEEDLYWQFTTFIARKNSVLLPELNDFILRAVSAGLHLHWETEADIRYNHEKQGTLLSSYKPSEYRMNISNFQGLFYLWIIGCAAATITFILEINMPWCISAVHK